VAGGHIEIGMKKVMINFQQTGFLVMQIELLNNVTEAKLKIGHVRQFRLRVNLGVYKFSSQN